MDQVFEKELVISPSISDSSGKLSFFAAFDVFMDIAAEHAQRLGIGMDAMASKDLFWLTVKTQIRFQERPRMMERVTLRTWPEAPGKIRGNRSYQLARGNDILLYGKTEWAVINMKTGQLATLDGVYPPALTFSQPSACPEPFARITDDFSTCKESVKYRVRSTDIDIGGHMNNAAYVRALLGCFSNDEIKQLRIAKMDVAFRKPCFEGEELLLQRKPTGAGADLRFVKADGSTALLVRIEAEQQTEQT